MSWSFTWCVRNSCPKASRKDLPDAMLAKTRARCRRQLLFRSCESVSKRSWPPYRRILGPTVSGAFISSVSRR